MRVVGGIKVIEMEVQKARQGECIWIRCCAEKNINIVVDAGPSTFNAGFKHLINRIMSNGERIDLLVFSHIDDDHTRGCIRYLQDHGEKIIDRVWINGFGTKVYSKMQEHSAKNIPDLTNLLEKDGIAIEHPIFVGKMYEYHGVVIKVIGPGKEDILAAAAKIDSGSIKEHASGVYTGDIDDTIDDYKVDPSPQNKASIIMIIEFENRKILLTGDNTSERILEALDKYYHCYEFDIVKLPHHGSPRNISRDFIRQVNADRYIISTNKMIDKVTLLNFPIRF